MNTIKHSIFFFTTLFSVVFFTPVVYSQITDTENNSFSTQELSVEEDYTTDFDRSYTIETVPNDQLFDAGDYVTNPDGIISSDAEASINQIIQSIKDSTTAEIAVVLLNSIGYEDIDNFATELFNHWGIGNKENNNGLLFLLVYEDRQMVFRTGYGLEGVLPDAIAYRIISTVIAPELRDGDFDSGIVKGMERVQYYLTDPEAAEEIRALKWEERKSFMVLIGINLVVLLLCGLLFLWIYKSKKTKPQQYKILKYIAIVMIFLAFFVQSLLVASIVFFLLRKWIRNKEIVCPHCGKKMKKLDEKEDNAYLTTGQDKEEEIGSIDYDVWVCDCGHKEVLAYKKMSKYQVCPHCDFRTYYVQSRTTLKSATTSSTGLEELVYACKHCGATKKQKRVIPKISESSSSGSGGGSSSGGGGSWGGGSTGGGGARGGW